MSDKSKLDLGAVLQEVNDFNQIQQIKAVGAQRRAASTSPNAITANGAPSPNTPKHVTNVHATLSRTSDVSSKVTVTFQQDPTDYYFSNAQVYVSGYKGNHAPVQVGSGQSPISFSLENSGDAVTITVQAVGSLGPAPLASAPTTTLKLDKTALVTVATPAGNGTSGGSSLTLQTNEVANSSQSLLDLHADAGIALTDVGGGQINIGLSPFVRFISGVSGTPAVTNFDNGSGTSWTSIGTVSTTTIANATATECAFKQTTTTSGTLKWLQIWDASIQQITLGILKRFKIKTHFFNSTNVRAWVALSDYTSSSGDQFQLADNPLSLCGVVGFRFSTFAGDAHWKVCVGPKSGSLTVIDTGIAFDGSGAGHIFEIRQESAGTLKFYIDGVLGATVNSNLPTNSTRLQWNTAVDNGSSLASIITLGFSWAMWEGTR